jgi:hypothetical protein
LEGGKIIRGGRGKRKRKRKRGKRDKRKRIHGVRCLRGRLIDRNLDGRRDQRHVW